MDDDRRAAVDGDAAQPGGVGRGDGAYTDGRQIGAPLLVRLGGLDEDTARSGAAELPAAREQRIGPLDRLDPEHEALLDDDRLSDIDRAERPRDYKAVGDIGMGLLIRYDAAEDAARRQVAGENAVDANHPEALALDLRDNRGEQPVVAERAIADAGEELCRPPVLPPRRHGRPFQPAGEDEFIHARLGQQAKALAGGAKA